MSNKIDGHDVLYFASRTNNTAASYMLRMYGIENFDGTQQEYFDLMRYLTTKSNDGQKISSTINKKYNL